MLAVVRTADEAYGMNVRRELEAYGARGDDRLRLSTLDRLEAKGFVFRPRVDRRCGVAPRLRGDPSGRSIARADA